MTVLIVAALATEVRLHVRGRRADRPSLWAFGLVAPALFTCQEHIERLAHDGTVPWLAGEPTFLAGLALQLPFALAAYLVARLLLRVARSIARVLAPLDPAPLARPRRVGRASTRCCRARRPLRSRTRRAGPLLAAVDLGQGRLGRRLP